MNGDFLSTTSEWVIVTLFLVLMVSAGEVGFRFGRRAGPRVADGEKSQISAVEAGMLGVLGLLLGFTMSMSVTRFEARKQLVLEEANAIGTAHLRTQLLPPAEGKEIADRLRAYVDVRIPRGSGFTDEQLQAARLRSAKLQSEFWQLAVAYGQKDPNPVRAGLLLQSLNQVIDMDAARWMAFQNTVPEAVIFVIALLALQAALTVGYTFGLQGRRDIFSMAMLVVAVTLVLMVIVDLDRPRDGLIKVSQQPMVDLQRQLQLPGQ